MKRRAVISVICAAALICGLAVVPVPSLGQARDSLIVAGYNGLTALFVRSAGLLNLKCDGTSMTCAWSGNTLTLSSGSSSSDPCAATITTTTVTLFATASSSTPCNIAIGSNSQRITGTATITSPSATDSFYTAVLTDGSVSIGAASATVTCTSIAVTCTTHTGISSFGDLGTQNIPLYFFASSTTHFVASLASSRPAMSYRAIAGGTNVTISDDGTTATINATGGGTSAALYADFAVSNSQANGALNVTKSYSLPGGTLATNNQFVQIDVNGYCATSTSVLEVFFGGTNIAPSLPTCSSTGTTQALKVSCIVARTGATSQYAECWSIWQHNSATYSDITAPAETLSGAVTIAVKTVSGGLAVGDVVVHALAVRGVY